MPTGIALEVSSTATRSEERARKVFARFGSFALVSDEPFEGSYASLANNLVNALTEDSRVVKVRRDTYIDEDWCQDGPFFPSPPGDEEVLGGRRWVALEFSDSIRFEIEVPTKNQRQFVPGESIPTHYTVWWNGVVVLIAWEVDGDEFPGMAGGHIVEEIIQVAAQSVGYDLYVQGCSPTCTYRFAHTTIALVEGRQEQTDIEYSAGPPPAGVIARLPPGRMGEPVKTLYADIATTLVLFTRVKNVGRRVLDLEQAARSDLGSLLALNNAHTELGILGFRKKVQQWVSLRGWRRRGRTLIARLWLELTAIEYTRRIWSEQNFSFEGDLRRGMDALFARDAGNDAAGVLSLDLSLLRSAVEHTAERQDSRALVTATAMGAVAGGLAAAVVTGILAG